MFNIPITITSQKEIMDVFEIFTKISPRNYNDKKTAMSPLTDTLLWDFFLVRY